MNGTSTKIKHSLREVMELHDLQTKEMEELERNISENNVIIRFKTERQEKEFNIIDIRLRIILYALAAFTKIKFNYVITITSLIRTQEEQDSIYKDYPEYKVTPWKSVHQERRGGDIRNNDMSEVIKKEVDSFLNIFVYTGKCKSRISHDVGRGDHFHVQVDPDFITSISIKGED